MKKVLKETQRKWHSDINHSFIEMKKEIVDIKNSIITTDDLNNVFNKFTKHLSEIVVTKADTSGGLAFDRITMIYNLLADNISKEIFLARLEASVSRDDSKMMKYLIARDMDYPSYCFTQFLRGNANAASMYNFVIYQTDCYSQLAYEILQSYGIKVVAFCNDSIEEDEKNQEFCGLPVVSFEKLKNDYGDCRVFFAEVRDNRDTLYKKLALELNSSERIITLAESLPNQYFEKDIIGPFTGKEIFVDAGGYHGETALDFIHCCKGNYEKIYVFEPDDTNFEICKSILGNINREAIVVAHGGLWSSDSELSFDNNGSTSGQVNDTAGSKIKFYSLDSFLKASVPVTFIKMDVEGSELEALKGCRATIIKYRPRLAISLYHRPEDIITIIEYIHSIVPDYKFYIRHYSTYIWETILYAV